MHRGYRTWYHHVYCFSKSDKLASKTGRLQRILALGEPDDRCILHVDQYTRMRPAGLHFWRDLRPQSMRNNRLTSGLGHVWREFPSDIPVEIPPVCIQLVHMFIDLRRLVWVKNHSSSVFVLLEISKYMVYHFEVPSTW